jgi:hypothetical protein
MNENQPTSQEQGQSIKAVDEKEREFFKNLRNRLLARAAFNMTYYPVGMALAETLMKKVNFLGASQIANPLSDGAVMGITMGAILTVKEIWNLGKTKFPREADILKSESK